MDTLSLAPFRLTDRAAARIADIVAMQPGQAALRVEVLAGGCNGFKYRFNLDASKTDEDIVIEHNDALVFIDAASMDLLAGSELDYTEALMGAHFAVRNPNAASSCGCGTSFSVA